MSEPWILLCEAALLPALWSEPSTPWSEPSGTGMWSQGAPHGDLPKLRLCHVTSYKSPSVIPPRPGRRSWWVSPVNTSTPPPPGLGLCGSIGPGQSPHPSWPLHRARTHSPLGLCSGHLPLTSKSDFHGSGLWPPRTGRRSLRPGCCVLCCDHLFAHWCPGNWKLKILALPPASCSDQITSITGMDDRGRSSRALGEAAPLGAVWPQLPWHPCR